MTPRAQLDEEVDELTWRWARELLGLHPDDPPLRYAEAPAEMQRAVQLALLAACEWLRAAVERRAGEAANCAAGAGADYRALGEAVGITKQGAHKRWPDAPVPGRRERTRP